MGWDGMGWYEMVERRAEIGRWVKHPLSQPCQLKVNAGGRGGMIGRK